MRRSTIILCTLLLVTACREGDGPADPSQIDAHVHLSSVPAGASITVDGRATGLFTPDTVPLRRGDRSIDLRLDSAGFLYDYNFILEVEPSDSVVTVEVPVGMQCLTPGGGCFLGARRHHEAAGMRFASSAVGTLFYWGGSGGGIIWPASTQNSYASSGMPLFAAREDGTPVSLGMYDQSMLVGLPAPRTMVDADSFRLEQQAWVLPPRTSLVDPATVRGIAIEQEIIGRTDVAGVIIMRLTFRNVSDEPMVHLFAPHIPVAPVTYTDAWIGFALDADIGNANDDWLSYDVDLDMVFAYDADFQANFTGQGAGEPALVGMRVLEAPAGAQVMLNAWTSGLDWNAGRPGEEFGYGMLSGTDVLDPEHDHERIGYLPPAASDVRMSVTAGPLTLAPGDAAEVVIALALAPPAAGTFTSGTTMAPGDPLDDRRPLAAVAAHLRERMIAAQGMF
jgi:hypothetical protein